MYKMKNACDGRNKLSQSIYSDSFLSIKLERKTGNRIYEWFPANVMHSGFVFENESYAIAILIWKPCS